LRTAEHHTRQILREQLADRIAILHSGRQPVGSEMWIALAWCVGILVVAYLLAMVTYGRRISR
jgi:ABC-2 type transport system permease protein